MAAVRSFSRLLTRSSLNNIAKRGYADEMNFTFAAGNQVQCMQLTFKTESLMLFVI